MNHLISELLPRRRDERELSNSDPITGQAAWYDLQVNVYPAAEGESGTWPQLPPVQRLTDVLEPPEVLRYATHKAVNLERPLADALRRGRK